MKITRKSVITGIERIRNIPVNPVDFATYRKYNMSIEDAMPYLDEEDKSFILSGITRNEWNDAFEECK